MEQKINQIAQAIGGENIAKINQGGIQKPVWERPNSKELKQWKKGLGREVRLFTR